MRELDDITLQAMQKLAKPDNPKILEDTFIQQILPAMAPLPNEPDPSKPLIERRELLIWTEWFQSPHATVDVHDRTGKFLFSVPGPLPQAETETTRRENVMPITEVIQHAQLHAQNHPMLGEAYLNEKLENRLKITSDENASVLARWNGVFRRYGYPLLIAPDGTIPVYDATPAITKSDVAIKDVDNTALFSDDDDEVL